jgi:hypothetical protein
VLVRVIAPASPLLDPPSAPLDPELELEALDALDAPELDALDPPEDDAELDAPELLELLVPELPEDVLESSLEQPHRAHTLATAAASASVSVRGAVLAPLAM